MDPQAAQPQTLVTSSKPKAPFFIYASLTFLIILGLVWFLSYKEVIRIWPPGLVSKQLQDKLLVSVGDREIFLSEVQKKTEEVLVKSSINKQALQNTLDQLIEQVILDIEAQKLNIQVTDQEIAQKVTQQKNATPSAKELERYSNIAEYQLLKERVTKKEVESRLAYVIGFWVPSYDYPDPLTDSEKAKFENMRQDGKKALDEAAQLLRKGDTPLSVTQYIFNKYPSLQERLALNNLIFKTNTDQARFTQPAIYIYSENLIAQPIYKALFSMQPDEIRIVLAEDGAGESIIQLKSITNSGFKNYKDWLEAKRKELVKIYNKI